MGVSARRRRHVPVLVAVLAAAFWLPAVARADEPPQFVSKPAVQGDPVVGSALTAVATWTGSPTPNATYRWGRCPATSNLCPEISGATSSQYVPTAADVGSRLAVEITLDNYVGRPAVMTSPATTLVRSRPAAAAPPPAPAPPASTVPATIPRTAASRASRPTLLDPFPVVRIRGFFRKTGSRITLLSVRGPQKAQVSVRCVGRRCPVKKVTLPRANVRVHTFERFLRAGIQLQIRVTRAGRIGSYTSFLIRARRAPLRVDRCLPSHSTKPVRCSTP
jgi:Ig domain of plant-specific actin-binding protein